MAGASISKKARKTIAKTKPSGSATAKAKARTRKRTVASAAAPSQGGILHDVATLLQHQGGQQPAKARRRRKRSGKGGVSGAQAAAFDPLHPGIPPSLTPMRNVFPMDVTVKSEYALASTTRIALFVSGWGGAANPYMWLNTTVGGGDTAYAFATDFFPTLRFAATSGGPTSCKISKIGFQIANATPAMTAGGRCFLIRLDQRFALPTAAASVNRSNWSGILDNLKALPSHMVESMNLAAFCPGGPLYEKSIYCGVDDFVDYQMFDNHAGAYKSNDGLTFAKTTAMPPSTTGPQQLPPAAVNDFFSHIAVDPTSVEQSRPMSSLIMIFEPPPNSQDLTISFNAQYLTRWPVDTVPGQMSGTVPASSQDALSTATAGSLQNVTAKTGAALLPGQKLVTNGIRDTGGTR